jgi:FkbM family methyltransferase
MLDLGPLYRMAYRASPAAIQVRLKSRRPPGILNFPVRLPGGDQLIFHGLEKAVFLRQLFWLGFNGANPEFARIFQALAKGATSVIDLGSYLGYYSLIAAKMNPSARVYSVEPLPDSISYQKQLFKINDVEDIQICPVGVAKETSSLPFYIPDRSLSKIPNIGSLTNRFGEGTFYEDRGSATISIDVLTLPDLVKKFSISRVDLIKFFVEEMEADVFKGGEPLLREWKPDLLGWIFFRNDSVERLGSILTDLGYSFFVIKGQHLVPCQALSDARDRGDVFNRDKGGRSAVLATAEPDKTLDRIRRDLPSILGS